jgi:hypothetical protein
MSRTRLIALLLLSACTPPEPIEISKGLPALELFHVAELRGKYDIRLDTAATYYNPGIGGLCLRYTSEELFDLCEARNLLVDLVDSLIRQISLDPGVGGAVTFPPFTSDNLDLIITFDSFYGQYVDLQYVNQIRLENGLVRYYAFSAFNCDAEHFEKHSEPYETARLNSYAWRKAKEFFPPLPEEGDIEELSSPNFFEE